MNIKVNQKEIEVSENTTVIDLIETLNLRTPDTGIGVSINGTLKDLSHPVNEGDDLKIYDFKHPEGKDIFWHTSAHVLAQAVLRLYPEATPTIGPTIEHGFYYDFANLTISEKELPKIEQEMKKIIKENFRTKKTSFKNKKEALSVFKNNPYKQELIESFDEDSPITAYEQGEFFDLCRGPHLHNLGKIKALKLLKTSGSYWRGDHTKEVLTRIYGITFPDKEQLKEYLHQIEEAKKRDHKIIGPRLDLFSLKEEAPGMPFIHHKGMILWNNLFEYWRECHYRSDYIEIKTPILMTKELWETSGHWENYKENMYTLTIDEREYAIKPMNCPGGMLFFRSNHHSYRELPLRVAEIGTVHRYEPSGALSGLFRARCFHQDDAHVFMKPNDITEEILNVLSLVDEMYSTFGLTYHLELSTRPEKNTIGTDQEWETATNGLKNALDKLERPYQINEGDGAFYGPKIDIHIRDAIGRTWQCGTIQLDMSLPERFDLEYTDSDSMRKRPIMIHRVIYGSIERFMGILIEHFVGRFPLWLSPHQIRLVPVADRHVEYAHQLKTLFKKNHFHTDVDDAHESVSKKIRTAQLQQINYILVVGDQEVENKTLTLRTRENFVYGEIEATSFLETIKIEKNHRDLHSPYHKPVDTEK
jgi:threonyl-tRNA synthetase